MIDVTIILPIEPEAKGRPKAAVIGGHARVYTPRKTQDYEARVREAAALRLPAEPIEGPLAVSIVFVLPRPGALMRKRDWPGWIQHTKRPDVDNLAKAVMDALSRHWRDDAQVCELHVHKVVAERNGLPRLYVRIQQTSEIAHVPLWVIDAEDARTQPAAPEAAPNATSRDLFNP